MGIFKSVFKRKDPDPYIITDTDPDPGDPKTYGSYGYASGTLRGTVPYYLVVHGRTLPELIGTGERLICEVQKCLPYLPMAWISAVEAQLMMVSTAAASSSAALKRESTMQLMASCTDCIRSMKAETTWWLVTFFALQKPVFRSYFHHAAWISW